VHDVVPKDEERELPAERPFFWYVACQSLRHGGFFLAATAAIMAAMGAYARWSVWSNVEWAHSYDPLIGFSGLVCVVACLAATALGLVAFDLKLTFGRFRGSTILADVDGGLSTTIRGRRTDALLRWLQILTMATIGTVLIVPAAALSMANPLILRTAIPPALTLAGFVVVAGAAMLRHGRCLANNLHRLREWRHVRAALLTTERQEIVKRRTGEDV